MLLCVGTGENDCSEKYLLAIVGVFAILLVISFVFNAYWIFQSRFKSQTPTASVEVQDTTNVGNNSGNVNDSTNGIHSSAYEQVEDEQHYTDLHRFGVGEYDDRSYAHLNQVTDVYVIQEETGV